MKSKITQLIEKLCAEKHADNAHCDVTSSSVHVVNVPIPTELFRELETISTEYKRDINCLAGDLLTLALEEAIEHIPSEEKKRLDEVGHEHELEEAKSREERSAFDAGGT
jgi:hypothetical protein